MFKKGATHKPAQTRACTHIEDAICATTDPRFFINTAGEAEMNSLLARARLMRYGGDCYNYAMLACGQIDAVVEQGLKAHDIQALIPIIEGAGGLVTNWQGESAAQGGKSLPVVMQCCIKNWSRFFNLRPYKPAMGFGFPRNAPTHQR